MLNRGTVSSLSRFHLRTLLRAQRAYEDFVKKLSNKECPDSWSEFKAETCDHRDDKRATRENRLRSARNRSWRDRQQPNRRFVYLSSTRAGVCSNTMHDRRISCAASKKRPDAVSPGINDPIMKTNDISHTETFAMRAHSPFLSRQQRTQKQ